MTQAAVNRTLRIANETRHLQSVREFVASVIRNSGVPARCENGILLAVDEAVTNIITHAYKESRHDTIEITLSVTETRFEVTIRDSGTSFDPKMLPDPDLRQHVSAGRRSGLGVFLMRRLMDEVEYLFKEGIRNELHMVKYLDR